METDNRPVNINITSTTIVKIIIILILIYFLYFIRDILAIFFVSLVFASAIDPMVDWLQKRKIPRSVGILFIYLILFAFFSLIVYLVIPPLVNEISQLSGNSPYYLDKINLFLKNFSDRYQLNINLLENIKNNIGDVGSNLQTAASGIFTTLSTVFGGIVSFILILVLIFYMVVEEKAMKKLVWSIAPTKHQPYILNLIDRMQKKIGLWLRGQLILATALFILVYIGLAIFKVNYALILAMFAGLTSFVPYMGAIFGSIPAILISFTQSPLLAVFVIALFYIVHLIEGNILHPVVMKKAVGINPIISITVLLIGFRLAGIIGAILSIPVTTAFSVLYEDIFVKKETKEEITE